MYVDVMGVLDRTGRRPTIGDVASVAGVSRGTVSRVLNGERYVSAHAAAAVHRAVRSTGFVPNAAARSLASKAAGAVAVIVDGAPTKLTSDSNTAKMLLAFQAELSRQGYRPVFQFLATPGDDGVAAALLLGRSADGVLLLSDNHSAQVMNALAQSALPAVTTCIPSTGSSLLTVAIDDERAAAGITGELVQSGRRRIGMIGVALNQRYGQARQRGFRTAVGASYDEDLVLEAEGCTFEFGYDAMMKLHQVHPDIDGVFVASDVVAAGALQALARLGRRVPDDIGVVGFDGNEWSTRCMPHLTTVSQPVSDVGRIAASALVDLMAGRKAASITVATEILLKESA